MCDDLPFAMVMWDDTAVPADYAMTTMIGLHRRIACLVHDSD